MIGDPIWRSNADFNKSSLLEYLGRRVQWAFGKHKPILAYLKITQRCNLSCQYCPWHSSANNFAGELTTQRWYEIIDDLFARGVRLFVLEGGEPTLRDDLPQLIERVNAIGGRTILATNGTARNPWAYSPDAFTTSLDGPEAYHDSIRGKGSFRKTIKRLEARGNQPTFCITVVSRGNIELLSDLCEQVSPLVSGFLFTFLYPYEAASHNSALQPQEIREAKARILELKSKYMVVNPRSYLKQDSRLANSCKDQLAVSVNYKGEYKYGCFVQHKEVKNCDNCELSCFHVLSAFHSFNLEVWFNLSRFILKAI